MKFLVFATDLLPVGGLPSSGTAIRTFGLVEGLRSNGHQVTVSVPQTAIDGFDNAQKKKDSKAHIDSLTRELAFSASNQLELVAEIQPDVIICGHWPAVQFPQKPSQVLIVDLAGPHMLERHFQGSGDQQAATLAKISAIATADGLLASGPSQRKYFESFVSRTGLPSPQFAQISMPLAPTPEAKNSKKSKEFPHFFFGGVFLPWQNPSHCLEHVADFLQRTEQGKLTLIGGKHPHYKVDSGVYEKLFSSLETNQRVNTFPLLPYEQYLSHLEHADVALDLMSWNLERELAIPIRSTNYLNSGIPVIHNNFSDLSKLIVKYDAGWCVEPDNSEALEKLLEEIASDPDIVEEKSKNAKTLAKDCFDWSKAVRPLIEMAENLRKEGCSFFDISINQQDSANLSPQKEKPLSQSFLTREKNLKSVEVLLTNKGRPSSSETTLVLKSSAPSSDHGFLRDSSAFKEVGRTTIPSGSKLDDQWVKVDLEKEVEAGSLMNLEIQSLSDSPETFPWTFHASPYPLDVLKQGVNLIKDTSLCIRTTHHRSDS